MRLFTLLGVVALTAPVLAGCVIYNKDSGETVRITVPENAGPVGEPVRAVRIEDGKLIVRVDSNGCTQASDFEVRVNDGSPSVATILRVKEDLCRALVMDGVEVSWAVSDLGLELGSPIRVTNALK